MYICVCIYVEYPNDVKFNIYVWNYLLWCNIFVRKMILLWLPSRCLYPSRTHHCIFTYSTLSAVLCRRWLLQWSPRPMYAVLWQKWSFLITVHCCLLFTCKYCIVAFIKRWSVFTNNPAIVKVLRGSSEGISDIFSNVITGCSVT